MTYIDFNFLFRIAQYSDYDTFVATIDKFGIKKKIADYDWDNSTADPQNIWDVANMSIREMITAANLSQNKLSPRFDIPIRTVKNWCDDIFLPESRLAICWPRPLPPLTILPN